jgi:hypothetical protein
MVLKCDASPSFLTVNLAKAAAAPPTFPRGTANRLRGTRAAMLPAQGGNDEIDDR